MFLKTKNQVLISSINERDKLLPKEVSIYFWISLVIGTRCQIPYKPYKFIQFIGLESFAKSLVQLPLS